MPSPRERHLLADYLRHPPPVADELPTLLLSIKPHFADLIALGLKRIEFRRRFPRQVTTARALFYTSSPTRALTLTATISQIRRGHPSALWRAYAELAGLPLLAFNTYFAGAATGVALLLLENVQPLPRPILLTDPRLRSIYFRPPQSLTVLPSDSPILTLIDFGRQHKPVDRNYP